MKNWWLKFGCFLIGYKYSTVKNCSEVAELSVKRYTSAILIVCILWSFIGYSFTNRYLHTDKITSLFGSILFVIIIIQIERYIILSANPDKKHSPKNEGNGILNFSNLKNYTFLIFYLARAFIAILMALIGSIIIDQKIFQEDIELEKITFNENRIKEAIEPRTKELRDQITKYELEIVKKELERNNLILEISEKPTLKLYSTETIPRTEKETKKDEKTGETKLTEKIIPEVITKLTTVANPKISLLAPLDSTLKKLTIIKNGLEKDKLNIRLILEREIGAKSGFLQELQVMYNIFKKSDIAMVVWFIWFLFLLGLELLVLLGKAFGNENDYEKTIKHQMELNAKRLELFASKSN